MTPYRSLFLPGAAPVIVFNCDVCSAELEVTSDLAGRSILCAKCHVRIFVPGKLLASVVRQTEHAAVVPAPRPSATNKPGDGTLLAMMAAMVACMAIALCLAFLPSRR